MTPLTFVCVQSWDLYSWPGTGENERFFEDHQPIFSETYLIAEDHETEVLEEIKATEPFHEAFIQTGEDALVSFEIGPSSGSRNEAVSDDSSNKIDLLRFFTTIPGSDLRFALSCHT